MHCIVDFPAKWINASAFEAALRISCGPHAAHTHQVTVNFPIGCKVMVDGAIRLLSLVNQLAFTTRRVRLNFRIGWHLGCRVQFRAEDYQFGVA